MQKTAFFRILKEFFLKKGKTLQAMCERCNVMAFSFEKKNGNCNSTSLRFIEEFA